MADLVVPHQFWEVTDYDLLFRCFAFSLTFGLRPAPTARLSLRVSWQMSKPTPPATFTYFAYGSNMLTRRLTASDRAPSAKRVVTGFVEGRRLTFDKVSQDGSGKCDAELTGTKTDRVYGVVFEIGTPEREALGNAEGLCKGYKEEIVKVVTPSGEGEHMTYIATRKEPALRPYHWYKALTIAGAVEHGLPNDYVEWIRTIESTEDPKSERRAKNEALLFAS